MELSAQVYISYCDGNIPIGWLFLLRNADITTPDRSLDHRNSARTFLVSGANMQKYVLLR